jgi:hypothetical protein
MQRQIKLRDCGVRRFEARHVRVRDAEAPREQRCGQNHDHRGGELSGHDPRPRAGLSVGAAASLTADAQHSHRIHPPRPSCHEQRDRDRRQRRDRDHVRQHMQ